MPGQEKEGRKRMKNWTAFGLLIGFMAFASTSFAQQDSEDSDQAFENWVTTIGSFVEDVTFDESDLESFLNHWQDLSSIMDEEEEEEGVMLDIGGILGDPRFQSWASDNGLDGEKWLQKSMRIVAVFMRGQYLQAMTQADAMYSEQLETIEQQRSQMGEESYQQMKTTMEAGAQRARNSRETIQKLPQPTASEQALLDKYQERLMSLMQDDEEGEEEW